MQPRHRAAQEGEARAGGTWRRCRNPGPSGRRGRRGPWAWSKLRRAPAPHFGVARFRRRLAARSCGRLGCHQHRRDRPGSPPAVRPALQFGDARHLRHQLAGVLPLAHELADLLRQAVAAAPAAPQCGSGWPCARLPSDCGSAARRGRVAAPCARSEARDHVRQVLAQQVDVEHGRRAPGGALSEVWNRRIVGRRIGAAPWKRRA